MLIAFEACSRFSDWCSNISYFYICLVVSGAEWAVLCTLVQWLCAKLERNAVPTLHGQITADYWPFRPARHCGAPPTVWTLLRLFCSLPVWTPAQDGRWRFRCTMPVNLQRKYPEIAASSVCYTAFYNFLRSLVQINSYERIFSHRWHETRRSTEQEQTNTRKLMNSLP